MEFTTDDNLVYMAKELAEALPLYRLTSLQYDVWHTMISWMKGGGYVHTTLEEIGEKLGSNKSNISPAIARIMELGLIWRVGPGVYRFNPRVIFSGTQAEWEKALAEVPDDVPEVRLPRYKRRPPRGQRLTVVGAA